MLIYTNGKENKYSTVPNVIGKKAEEANQILASCGFNIKIEGTTNFTVGQSAYVTSQYPQANTSYTKGGVVTIKILYTDEKD